MKTENILLFQPMRTTWHHLFECRQRSIIHLKPTDPLLKKGAVHLMNGVKKRIIDVAIAVATVFAFLYSLITFPARLRQAMKLEEEGIDLDLARLSPEEKQEIESMLDVYFNKREKIFGSITPQEKNKITLKVVSNCARSKKVYGPVVKAWVDQLLETAHRDGKKLVFMARDGIPFYQVAVELMKKEDYKAKYPELTQKNAIVLGHFSRKVVRQAEGSTEGRNLFERYANEELGIEPEDRCTFVDIGFEGSMIQPLRNLLPKVKTDFKFLISITDRAEGFLGNLENPLPRLHTARNNLGVRWLEETHHGNTASPEKLVLGEDNRVHPDTHYPKKIRFEEKYSTSYLIRKFCLKNLVQHAAHLSPLSKEETEKARSVFDRTIGQIKNSELPLFLGWDY